MNTDKRPFRAVAAFLVPIPRAAGNAALAALLLALLAGCASPLDRFAQRSDPIKNVVVIYAENHSFDNMYGMFPGANGVANATAQQATQVGHDGKPLSLLVVCGLVL